MRKAKKELLLSIISDSLGLSFTTERSEIKEKEIFEVMEMCKIFDRFMLHIHRD